MVSVPYAPYTQLFSLFRILNFENILITEQRKTRKKDDFLPQLNYLAIFFILLPPFSSICCRFHRNMIFFPVAKP